MSLLLPPFLMTDINLQINSGETVALVGPSGVGKTTLAGLVPRFYDATVGQVCVDNIDVRGMQIDALRRQVGVVPQETFLFNTTIRDNIGYGKPNATQVEIESAAKASNIFDFIIKSLAIFITFCTKR